MAARIRQQFADLIDRLFFVPLAFVVTGIVLSQISLAVDRTLDNGVLPSALETTVESGRSILSTIAGGLIASVTLLLSLTLVAVQLASSQFSPRTLRNWIGDRTLQTSIGIVLGTSVFCLLILRETRNFGDGSGDVVTSLVPHVSVLLAVVLGVASLVSVVRAVDHLTDSLRIGSVAQRIMASTLSVIADRERIAAPENPAVAPASANTVPRSDSDIPETASAITCAKAGWVQRIDEDVLIQTLSEGSTAWITASVGTFALPDAPLMWTTESVAPDDPNHEKLQSAFVVGTARTMNQDVGYGILRMVDIALRALSPGVNDPNTANDMVMHLAVILLRIWEQPPGQSVRERDGRRIVQRPVCHADYLFEAFDPIRRYGCGDPRVAETLIRTLRTLRSETRRRNLPGPIQPLDDMIERIGESVALSDLLDHDKRSIRLLVDS